MHIIACDLSDMALEGKITSNPDDLRVCFASRYCKEEHFSSDRVYVLKADEFAEAIDKLTPRASILCIGKPKTSALPHSPKIDLLWTREQVSPSEVIDRINEAISKYKAWDDSINDAFSVSAPLRRIAELTEPMFENPIWMWDAQLQTVFHVAPKGKYEYPENYKMHNDGKPWPIAEVNSVNKDFKDALESREPHELSPMFGYISLCYNLYDGDTYIATLTVDNISGKDFNTRDKVLIKYLGDRMAHAIKYEAHFSRYATYIVNEQLNRLLEGSAVPKMDLQSALTDMGWDIADTYYCILAHQQESTFYPDVLLIPAAEAACGAVHDTLFFIIDGSILFVTNYSLSQVHPNSFNESINSMLRKKGFRLRLGVSTPFADFTQVRYFYDQAHDAIHLGERVDGSQDIYMFHDYILDAMISRCLTNTVPETLYPPELSRLIRYDAANDGNLVEVLKQYLACEMSMKRTAEALFMHRNTLLSRLKTIEQVGGFELGDYRKRLELMMAFALTDEIPDTWKDGNAQGK